MCFCAAIIYKSSVMGVSGIFPDVQYFPFQLIIVLVLGSATFFSCTWTIFNVSSKLILVITMPHIKITYTEKVTVIPVTKINNKKPLHVYRISILASQLRPFKINNLIEREIEDNTKECRLYYRPHFFSANDLSIFLLIWEWFMRTSPYTKKHSYPSQLPCLSSKISWYMQS